jgi:glycogen operon protein
MFFNAQSEDRTFTLPEARFGERWALVLTTADPQAAPNSTEAAAGEELLVTSRSVTILRRR